MPCQHLGRLCPRLGIGHRSLRSACLSMAAVPESSLVPCEEWRSPWPPFCPRRSAYASIDTNTRDLKVSCAGSCAPATGINSPQRGASMTPLRASLARSPPRLGRSQAGGLHPQTPRAAPPGAPSRTGPPLPWSPSRKGSGHGCDGGGGGQPLAVVHARRLASLSPLDSVFQKQGNRSVGKPQALSTGGRQSLQRRRWADPGTARRAALSHLGWAAGLSTAERATGRSACATRFPPAAGAPPSLRRIRGRFS